MKLGFLASHRGTDMQAVLDACAEGRLRATPVVVITELEAKRNDPEIGYFARHALRILDELRIEHERLDQIVEVALVIRDVDDAARRRRRSVPSMSRTPGRARPRR